MSLPQAQLRLSRVHGFRGHQVKNSAAFIHNNNSVVYIVAGLAIVWSDGEQRFYCEHTDDVISLAVHEDECTVATGQIGSEPFISIWDTKSMESVSILRGNHKLGISTLQFGTGTNSKLLVSCGLEPTHNLVVWDWMKGLTLAHISGHDKRVFDACLNPNKGNQVVSCGINHVKFWTLAGNTLTTHTRTFDGVRDNVETQLSIAFEKSQDGDERIYTAGVSGTVYIWNSAANMLVSVPCHDGPVLVIHSTSHGLATGGKDGCLRLWEPDLGPIAELDLNEITGENGTVLRTVYWADDRILVGTKNNQLLIVRGDDKMNPEFITQGHRAGELWGLAMSPNGQEFVTASDDGSIRLWDFESTCCIKACELGVSLRSCQYTSNGHEIVVAGKSGRIFVISSDLETVIHQIKHRDSAIDVIIFTERGILLTGSSDGYIDSFDPKANYKCVNSNNVCDSFIAHIDLVDNHDIVLVTTGTGDLIYVHLNDLQVIQTQSQLKYRPTTHTSPMLPDLKGIWGHYSDSNDINIATHLGNTVATGDDYGNVKLFKYPCPEPGALRRTYRGHSAHVTNLAFDISGRWLVSTGGADNAVFLWRYHAEGGAESVGYDSEEAMSDYEDETMDQIDSDVEAEVQVNYDRKSAPPPPATSIAKVSRKAPPLHSAHLQHVLGMKPCNYLVTGKDTEGTTAEITFFTTTPLTCLFITWPVLESLSTCDDILCLTHHPDDDLVATGQVGKDPPIHVWHLKKLTTLSILKGYEVVKMQIERGHSRGICTVDFHPDGKRLVSVGLDNDHTICLWDWAKGLVLASTRGHKDKIFSIAFNPVNSNEDTMLCIAFDDKGTTYTGSASGSICVWDGNMLKRVIKAHKGPLFAIYALERAFMTGGKDGVVRLWSPDFTRTLHELSIEQQKVNGGGALTQEKPSIRALVADGGKIFVGTKTGEVLQLDHAGSITILAQGHAAGELWGLCVHPTKQIVATVSDDKTLRVWNLDKREQISLLPLHEASRSVAFNPTATILAIGFRNGVVHVCEYPLQKSYNPKHKLQHRSQNISDIKFSPNGELCAVASHDNFVDIYNTNSFKRTGVCKGPSSYITHVDWNLSGELLMTNSGARELLYFRAPKGKRQPISKAAAENIEWQTWTCVLGPRVIGIWPPATDVTDVNATCLSKDRKILATADDFGLVKLFEFPVTTPHAKHKTYIGHSSHVTNIRFTYEDQRIVSTGGNDTAILVWDFGASHDFDHVDEMHEQYGGLSDTDSEEEGYDSDVERERNIDYKTKTYIGRGDALECKSKLAKRRKRSKRDVFGHKRAQRNVSTYIKSLKLDFIHGYRGFDARDNIRFIDTGTIVFHAAGACVVMDVTTCKQRFYLQHTDDVLCLAVNPRKASFVATGQVGEEPSIHVWNAKSLETISILSGVHTTGIGSIDFSNNGKVLLSVGITERPRVCVHRWQTGVKLGSVDVKSRIFVARFRPESDVEFVTAGIKHLYFWTITGSSLLHKRGVIGPEMKMTTMLGVAFGKNDITFSSAMDSDVWIWKGTRLMKVVKAHSRPCFTMSTHISRSEHDIITGGKDGYVKVWDAEMNMKEEMHIPEEELRSVCRSTDGSYLVGTESGSIYMTRPGSDPECILSGHGQGEVWALDVPSKSSFYDFATASDDKSLRFYKLNPPGLAFPPVHLPGPSRCLSVSEDGKSCYVGLESGSFIVYDIDNLSNPRTKRDRGNPIRCIKLSPCQKILAAASDDVAIDFYESDSLSHVLIKLTVRNHSTDWDTAEIETSKYDIVYVEAPSGKLVSKPTQPRWAERTGVLDRGVLGIWPQGVDRSFVNCTARSIKNGTVVTGDDMGFVKLFPYPCFEPETPHETYVGHAAEVTNIAFASNDDYIISTGGDDSSLFAPSHGILLVVYWYGKPTNQLTDSSVIVDSYTNPDIPAVILVLKDINRVDQLRSSPFSSQAPPVFLWFSNLTFTTSGWIVMKSVQ
eukprot:gene6723-357_t